MRTAPSSSKATRSLSVSPLRGGFPSRREWPPCETVLRQIGRNRRPSCNVYLLQMAHVVEGPHEVLFRGCQVSRASTRVSHSDDLRHPGRPRGCRSSEPGEIATDDNNRADASVSPAGPRRADPSATATEPRRKRSMADGDSPCPDAGSWVLHSLVPFAEVARRHMRNRTQGAYVARYDPRPRFSSKVTRSRYVSPGHVTSRASK